jgi:hypothetical protein
VSTAAAGAPFKPGDLLTLTGTSGAPPQVGMVVEFNDSGGTLLRIIVGGELIDVVVVQPASLLHPA